MRADGRSYFARPFLRVDAAWKEYGKCQCDPQSEKGLVRPREAAPYVGAPDGPLNCQMFAHKLYPA